MIDPRTSAAARMRTMIALIFAGEMIFALPFHLPRYFRPSVLAAFDLSNTALGDVFALYGITAMLAYFPGGALTDRASPRGLMCASLLATALGGLYLATFPGRAGLGLLYAWWGVTTILLFWAALIRATREWGGSAAQGRAFGLLDGGRGLAAAAMATAASAIFGSIVGAGGELTAQSRHDALREVILLYTAATAAAAFLVWRWVPRASGDEAPGERLLAAELMRVLRLPAVWLQALVVVCAYCGYKGLDNYGLFLHQVMGVSETRAAGLTALGAYLRVPAALVAGLVADRIGVARSITGLFAGLAAVYVALAVLTTQSAPASLTPLLYANLALSFVAVFALRGVYFALLEASAIPAGLTGAAVGVVSVIGFTPDVFFGALAGRVLDASPGAGGHHHYFILLAGIAIIGLATTWTLAVVNRRRERS